MNDTALHIIVIAATFFLAGAVAILLAGLNPAWKETVRGLWSAYRLEFAIVGRSSFQRPLGLVIHRGVAADLLARAI